MDNTSPAWLSLSFIKQTDIAKRMNISADLLSKKIKGTQRNQLTDEDLTKLEEIRKAYINELSSSPQTVSNIPSPENG